jgi:hypothetical protein
MKTTIKATVSKSDGVIYGLSHLDNEAELRALINEARAQLSPCAHCGFDRPVILYDFFPESKNTLREYDPLLPEMNPCRHEFCVVCNEFDIPNERTHGCRIRTDDYSARDDEASIRDALGILVAVWNRRPDESCP